MSKSSWVVAGAILIGCIIYILSPGPGHWLQNPVSWELREQLVFLTGACNITLMVVSVVISVRWRWVSRRLHYDSFDMR